MVDMLCICMKIQQGTLLKLRRAIGMMRENDRRGESN
jgi:hypothetical protein